jgi:hypothetical protein
MRGRVALSPVRREILDAVAHGVGVDIVVVCVGYVSWNRMGWDGMGWDEMSKKRRSETGREGVNVTGSVSPVRVYARFPEE